MAIALLDTDILSAVMRQNPAVMVEAQAYLALHGSFTFSIITKFEILRGLESKSAMSQLSIFKKLCGASNILPLTDAIVDRAAGIYADLYRSGRLIGDADILIASTAMEHGLTLVTNNESHHRRIAGLTFENWLSD